MVFVWIMVIVAVACASYFHGWRKGVESVKPFIDHWHCDAMEYKRRLLDVVDPPDDDQRDAMP